ncbi:hypothetical protein [Streptacidiphilus sp. PAMC 29251]
MARGRTPERPGMPGLKKGATLDPMSDQPPPQDRPVQVGGMHDDNRQRFVTFCREPQVLMTRDEFVLAMQQRYPGKDPFTWDGVNWVDDHAGQWPGV